MKRYGTILGASVSLWLIAGLSAQEAPTTSAWDGVYTTAQADRGDTVYEQRCAACHGADMRGGPGVPGVSGPELLFVWNNQSAWALYDLIRTSMPLDNPAGLNEQQYVDVLAAILRGAGFPASETAELTADRPALESIQITREKPQS